MGKRGKAENMEGKSGQMDTLYILLGFILRIQVPAGLGHLPDIRLEKQEKTARGSLLIICRLQLSFIHSKAEAIHPSTPGTPQEGPVMGYLFYK